MDQLDSSVLLGWVALGEAAPAAALAIVCVLCAGVVAAVLGGLSVLGSEPTWLHSVGPRARATMGVAGCGAGAFALGLMLREMRVDGTDWYTAVSLFSLIMLGFVAAQFSLAPASGAVERPVAATPKITVRSGQSGAAAASQGKKAA
ncbi:MAG: hypothetical protein IPI84_12530 [Holophagaceae bacterium]|nr:hypothetical protein [Holophagaceae bacterium]